MGVVDPHYLWAFGHLTVVLNAAYILFQTVLFRGTPTIPYRLLYVGAILSYVIVVGKSLGRPNGVPWLRRAFVDENAQYGLLAFYWLISKPINVTILPFATFSIFHCATFLRTNVLPKFYSKPVPGAAAGQRPPPNWAENLGRQIQLWVKGNYDKAMNFVAHAELLILARVTIGALMWRSSFVAPLFLAHFIRLRYHASLFTRTAVDGVAGRIDGLVNANPGAKNVWTTVKRVIRTWGGGAMYPAGAAAGAPAAAPAAAPAGAGAGPGAAPRR